ncbi:MAG: TetR family transcriptional regulator [Desulfarculaceae bacterium]
METGEKLEKMDSRQRILHAAAHLFAGKGYAATGVREISSQAEVNLSMINYFFGSKMGLLEEILRGFFEGFIAVAQKAFSRSRSPEENLRRFMRQAVRYFADHQEALMVYLLELSRDEPETLDLKAHYMGRFISLFIQHIYEPLFQKTGRSLPLGVIGPAMGGLIVSQFQMRPMALKLRPQDVENLDWDCYADLISELFLNGINGLLARQPEENEES